MDEDKNQKQEPRPEIRVGEWIKIGNSDFSPDGIVGRINKDDTVEVVYADNKNVAVYEPVKWNGKHWEFVHKGPSAGYAENHSQFSQYANAVRAKNRPTKKRRRR